MYSLTYFFHFIGNCFKMRTNKILFYNMFKIIFDWHCICNCNNTNFINNKQFRSLIVLPLLLSSSLLVVWTNNQTCLQKHNKYSLLLSHIFINVMQHKLRRRSFCIFICYFYTFSIYDTNRALWYCIWGNPINFAYDVKDNALFM